MLDTDVASLMFRRKLPSWLASRLVGYRPAITFVTLAELNKWTHLRSWGLPRRERLEQVARAVARAPRHTSGRKDVGRDLGVRATPRSATPAE